MAPISFARGVPTPEALPVEELADCARAAVERDGPTVLNYGPVAGYQPLREWIAERHGVETSQVLITNGSLQGLSLLAGLLLDPGSRILVEGPTYDRTLHIAARHEAEPVPLPMDDDGLDPGCDRAARRVPLHDPDLPEPERADALARAPPSDRRARPRREAARRRGRPVLARPLRGRAPARRSTSSPRARASSTRSRSRRSPRRGSGSAT